MRIAAAASKAISAAYRSPRFFNLQLWNQNQVQAGTGTGTGRCKRIQTANFLISKLQSYSTWDTIAWLIKGCPSKKDHIVGLWIVEKAISPRHKEPDGGTRQKEETHGEENENILDRFGKKRIIRVLRKEKQNRKTRLLKWHVQYIKCTKLLQNESSNAGDYFASSGTWTGLLPSPK